MNVDSYTPIITAFNEGRKSDVVRLINHLGEQALGDAHLMQLMALSRHKQIDERTLLQSAAYDCETLDAQAMFNLGVCEQEQGNIARACLCYSQSLRLDPQHSGALNNFSDLLRRQCRSEEAWKAITAYLAVGADTDGLEIRIAKIADDCGLPDEADTWFGRAVAKDPDNQAVVWERAMQLLRDEKFADGWKGYEARKAIFAHDALAIVRYSAPEWDGGATGPKSLLIHKEQGFGDTIMFASCLPDLPIAGAKVHLAVQPSLVRLFKASFPKAEIWPSASSADADSEEHQGWRDLAGPIDLQVPFGSLPLHVRTAEEFPEPKAYLQPFASDVAVWQQRIAALSPNDARSLKVGIVITARRDGLIGPGVAEGLPKSLPPRMAGELANRDVVWFGLHNLATAGDLAEVPKLDVVDTSPWLYDFEDTAAAIANLDVVVAVDTAVAHLAGAMGKKVLLMLRRHADWRWGRRRTDSYWYNDVEVFRQQDEGLWEPVVKGVAERIAELATDRRQSEVAQNSSVKA